ncbi:MAG TPA: hypothetical protein VKY74_07125, partial [Chloroflexia bacterium]|nr:hypothetical protein [Chloroflexia bacterium]
MIPPPNIPFLAPPPAMPGAPAPPDRGNLVLDSYGQALGLFGRQPVFWLFGLLTGLLANSLILFDPVPIDRIGSLGLPALLALGLALSLLNMRLEIALILAGVWGARGRIHGALAWQQAGPAWGRVFGISVLTTVTLTAWLLLGSWLWSARQQVGVLEAGGWAVLLISLPLLLVLGLVAEFAKREVILNGEDIGLVFPLVARTLRRAPGLLALFLITQLGVALLLLLQLAIFGAIGGLTFALLPGPAHPAADFHVLTAGIPPGELRL